MSIVNPFGGVMRRTRVWAAAALIGVAACGGGGGDGGGVTDPAVFTTLSVTPASVALVLVGGTPPTQQLTPVAKNQNGAVMSGLTNTTYTSANTAVATVNSAGVVTAVAVGNTQITVSGTIGTVTKTQSVNVTVAVPGATATVDATLQNEFSPKTVAVTRNGTVTWTFATLHNVTFGAGGPGNIADRSSGSASLQFPTAGTFNYSCTIHAGMTGTVVVQ
jgi:plastocyanin